MKNEADLGGFFAGTGFQYLWIGDEKERRPCGLTIFPIEEDLLKYSPREMDRLPDGTICFKDEFIPNLSGNQDKRNDTGVDQYLPAVDRRRTADQEA